MRSWFVPCRHFDLDLDVGVEHHVLLELFFENSLNAHPHVLRRLWLTKMREDAHGEFYED